MNVRRLIIIFAAGLLCGCVLVAAGCGSSDPAVTTITAGTTATTSTAVAGDLPETVTDGTWELRVADRF